MTVPTGAKSFVSTANSGESEGVGGAPSDSIEGDRLDLCRYDVELDRGGVGLPMAGDRGPSSLYDELLLRAGLLTFDDAGDCCAGGVYGISPNVCVRGCRVQVVQHI